MRFKNIGEYRELTKDFNKKQLKDFLKSLSDDELYILKEHKILNYKIDYTFLDDDFTDYTEDENELKRRANDIKETILNYNIKDLDYTKESITNPYILYVLAHRIKDVNNDLTPNRLNQLISNYNKINDFINNNDDYMKILDTYGGIINKNDNGFYEVNDVILDKITSSNDLDIKKETKGLGYDILDFDNNMANDEEQTTEETVKDVINNLWEDKKKILDPSKVNDLSIKQNGLNIKQFIFCEEYLKRGKIKPTCDNLGISRNTAYLWLKDSKVNDYLKTRQEQIKKETDATFTNTYNSCFNELNKMVNSGTIDTSDKIKAIDTFLKHYENIERLKQPPIDPIND